MAKMGRPKGDKKERRYDRITIPLNEAEIQQREEKEVIQAARGWVSIYDPVSDVSHLCARGYNRPWKVPSS
jgi:hypothetical protein